MELFFGHTKKAISDLFGIEADPIFSRTDEEHGDFSTNVAMQLAGKLVNPPAGGPREIAEQITQKLAEQNIEASVAGPGFINIRLPDHELFTAALAAIQLDKPLEGKTVVAEYSDPNPFKVLHAGHLYTSLVGDAIANIMQVAGGNVHRVNFGGDVGLHVGKTMWAIIQELGGEFPDKLADISDNQKLDWISARYVIGNSAYEENEAAKAEIVACNKRAYQVHAEGDETSPFAQIYWACRQLSYDGFDALYKRLGMTPFEKYYPESAVSSIGLETVKKHLGSVYEESDGAVIFRGEPYGLFTQVFINSEGLPTYAGKDVGLIQQKFADYRYDLSYIITDVSQKGHLSVVMKSIEQFEPELTKRTVHHTHGRLKMQGGVKMSSRKGNILKAEDILDAAFAASEQKDSDVVLGAVRYSFLKNRIGGDIIYDPEESVAQEGNSGPYLQYALVRARSILRKASFQGGTLETVESLDGPERSLARKLSMYPEAFSEALSDYSPHHICNYLFELAQVFNRFYEQSRVINDPRADVRAALVQAYEQTLCHGLTILGMPRPEEM